jgi:protein arginine kinase activator
MSYLCDQCKQARATVQITSIDPENKQGHEVRLCEACARESGNALPLPGPIAKTVATLASNLLNLQDKVDARRGSARKTVCPSCGMSYQEFRIKGRFGCAQCYDAFEEGLVSLLDKVHGASQYVGAYPADVSPTARNHEAVEHELADAKRRLAREIKNENYEEAARVRDRIQELESLLSAPPPAAQGSVAGDEAEGRRGRADPDG